MIVNKISTPLHIRCEYRRGANRCTRKSHRAQRLCAYHGAGGDQLEPGRYLAVELGCTVSARERPPARGDIRRAPSSEGKPVTQRFDGKQWRRCCRVCWRFGRPEYCRHHDPAVQRVATPGSKARMACSRLACRFMDELERETGCRVVHRHFNAQAGLFTGREHEIPGTSFRVDGFVAGTPVVLEFLGDYWHGNPQVYDGRARHPTIGQPFAAVLEQTMARLRAIAACGYSVFYIWESEYRRYLQQGQHRGKLLSRMRVIQDKQ